MDEEINMKKAQYQYEPLVTPEGWQGSERRFAIRLTELLDALFQRLGSMERRLRALEAAAQKEEET